MDIGLFQKITQYLIGHRILHVREMTADECNERGWYKKGFIIILDNETILIVASDNALNSAGVIEVQTKNPDDDFLLHNSNI